jgi:Tfp pilus assembly protein PilX
MALVMAMLALLILSVLVVAFSLLASTEPTIASNQLRVAQARALAEAGVERVVWALTQGKSDSTISGSLASPLPTTVPAPYNGSQLVSVTSGGGTIGGFYVNVTTGSDSHERWVQSIGWVPTDDSTDTRTKARQTINVTLMDFPTLTSMPCAVCVRGDIQIGGTSPSIPGH